MGEVNNIIQGEFLWKCMYESNFLLKQSVLIFISGYIYVIYIIGNYYINSSYFFNLTTRGGILEGWSHFENITAL